MADKYILKPEDYIDDAKKIGCELAVMLAVFEVESSGKGFYSDGVPKTLFEGHIFYRQTKGKYAQSHPHLCYKSWTRKWYGKTEAAERARLEEAAKLNRTAALMSASWGLPQIMGFNHNLAGYNTLQGFINAMYRDANSQLECFTNFILNSHLDDELRDKRWRDFARLYNGPGQVDIYAPRMEKAYNKFKKLGY